MDFVTIFYRKTPKNRYTEFNHEIEKHVTTILYESFPFNKKPSYISLATHYSKVPVEGHLKGKSYFLVMQHWFIQQRVIRSSFSKNHFLIESRGKAASDLLWLMHCEFAENYWKIHNTIIAFQLDWTTAWSTLFRFSKTHSIINIELRWSNHLWEPNALIPSVR